MFTGDRSGDFLYARLHEASFASQPESRHRDDGLRLSGAYITATVRCAPPDNKPTPAEVMNCRRYLESELEILHPRAVLALGRIAFDGYVRLLREQGSLPPRARLVFRHGAHYDLPVAPGAIGAGARLFAVYHPSQQNTQTGRVTPAMYRRVLREIRRYLASR